MGPNLLWLIILLFSVRDAIAVPHLVERQGEGSLGDDWMGNAGAAAAAFASGAKIPELLNNLKEFVMPSPQPDPTADPATDPVEANPPAKGQDLDSRPEAVPGQALPGVISPDTTEGTDAPVDIELSAEGAPYVPPTKEDECIVTSQHADHDPTQSEHSSPCNGATRQIIYTADCERSPLDQSQISAQATALQEALSEMVGTAYRTIHRACGIYFFSASLTKTQIDTLEKLSGPPIIVPDKKFEIVSTYSVQVPPIKRRNRLSKRKDAADIIHQENAYNDLAFISTPPRLPAVEFSNSFYYFQRPKVAASQPVLVYVVDTGAEILASEFIRESGIYDDDGNLLSSNVIKDWLHTEDSEAGKSDYHPKGHGTCVTSKIVGGLMGVDKFANIIMVKTMGWVSSVLDALSKIILDIERRTILLMKGRVVINISIGWDGDFGINEGKLKDLVIRLVNEFQAVIVVGAGEDKTGKNGPVDSYPALFSPGIPIIVVGSVQAYGGATLEWSRSGSAITTTAPAYVRCAEPSPGFHNDARYSGTGYSAAMVSGVISAWLSDEYGDELRKDPLGTPQAVNNLVRKLSYVRESGTLPGIWNGVNFKDPSAFPPTPSFWNMWEW